MSQVPGPEGEVARLREDLDLSRRELADARTRLEAALEEAAAERLLREQADAPPASANGRPAKRGRLADRLRRQTQ